MTAVDNTTCMFVEDEKCLHLLLCSDGGLKH